jgi:hypothetical protein
MQTPRPDSKFDGGAAQQSEVRAYECDGCGRRVPGVHTHEWYLGSPTPDGSFCCWCRNCGDDDCFGGEGGVL